MVSSKSGYTGIKEAGDTDGALKEPLYRHHKRQAIRMVSSKSGYTGIIRGR
jgi:hypothetical protein